MAKTDCAQNVPKKRLYSINVLATEIGGTQWFWRSQIWDGQLPFVQVGRKMYVDSNDVKKFIQVHKHNYLSGSYRIIGGKMKVFDLFDMMNELDSSITDLADLFDNFEVFIFHYRMDGKGADEVESMTAEIAEEEITGHLLEIIDVTEDIISIASKLRTAAINVDYEEYL